jgi:bacteriorhodopsin
MNNIIYRTGKGSLFIQVLTLFLDMYVLSLKISPSMIFVKSLLWLELLVQLIEGSFYVWLVMNFAKIDNITPFRYYDWALTTPTMLFTYCMYLYYERTKDQESFYTIVEKNTPTLVPIFILNTLMLLFGYLSEMGRLSVKIGTGLGFLPFFAMFYLIYENYAKFTVVGQTTFVYFMSVWGLYGVAALLSYNYKNAFYNILDLFSKNFFGIFLAGVILYDKYW